jgi:hypothetical protein
MFGKQKINVSDTGKVGESELPPLPAWAASGNISNSLTMIVKYLHGIEVRFISIIYTY